MPNFEFAQLHRIYNNDSGTYYEISDPEGFDVIEISFHNEVLKEDVRLPYMEIEEAELIIIGLQKMIDFLKEQKLKD